jgi:Asp-tRNA(Asn)/Glu-tRNA(Gln) amidotransferase A subunit family amidase
MTTHRVGCLAFLALLSLWHRAAAQAPDKDFHLLEATVDDVELALRERHVTCRDLVRGYLDRIEAFNHRGPALNAVETVNAASLEEADRLDARLRATGPVGPLHCIPVLVKDQLDTTGIQTTYGSRAFQGFVPVRDATVVARLKNAGAVIIGKATMGELASGYASGVSGAIRNPYDPTRHASGSSGGVGAGLAANLATVGIGEDTGGSIRGPAAVGSLVGLRPTVPLVSRAGLFPARPTTDTIGPITRTVRDASLVLDVIAGFDDRDPITAQAVGQQPPSYTGRLTREALQRVRLGVLRQSQDGRTDITSETYRAIHRVFDVAVGEVAACGASLHEVPGIPDLPRSLDEAYDGNVFETKNAVDAFLKDQKGSPFATFRTLLLSGRLLPSRSTVLITSVNRTVADAGYARIQHTIEGLRRAVLGAMAAQQLDAIVYVTADLSPEVVAADVMTNPGAGGTRLGSNRRLASVLGFPAITVPAGYAADGIPVGLELMGRPFSEGALLSYAYAFEQATHHRRPPPLTPSLDRSR